jgi:hypothetical protein
MLSVLFLAGSRSTRVENEQANSKPSCGVVHGLPATTTKSCLGSGRKFERAGCRVHKRPVALNWGSSYFCRNVADRKRLFWQLLVEQQTSMCGCSTRRLGCITLIFARPTHYRRDDDSRPLVRPSVDTRARPLK